MRKIDNGLLQTQTYTNYNTVFMDIPVDILVILKHEVTVKEN